MIELSKKDLDFSRNVAQFVSMRLIDKAFLGSKPVAEELLFKIVGQQKEPANIRSAYYHHLDDSGLFFLKRIVAKIAYYILFPLMNQFIQKKIEITSFDLTPPNFEKNLKDSNLKLDAWIKKLEEISRNIDPKMDLIQAIEKSLKATDSEILNDICKEFSFGSFLYNKFQNLKTGLKPLDYVLQFVLYPIALLLKLVFLIPDKVIQNILKRGISRVLDGESLVTLIDRGANKNKRLLTPALMAIQSMLSDLADEVKKQTDQGPIERVRPHILRNIALTREAVELFFQKTVGDLKERVENGPSYKSHMDAFFDKHSAKGIESIIRTLIEKARDPSFVKKHRDAIIENVQHSFENYEKADEKEHKFFEALQHLFATAISRQINSLAYSAVYENMGKIFHMNFTPQFVRFGLEVKA